MGNLLKQLINVFLKIVYLALIPQIEMPAINLFINHTFISGFVTYRAATKTYCI